MEAFNELCQKMPENQPKRCESKDKNYLRKKFDEMINYQYPNMEILPHYDDLEGLNQQTPKRYRFQIKLSESRVPFDGLNWNARKRNADEVRIKYLSFESADGENVDAAVCRCVTDSNLEKTVYKTSDYFYVEYTLKIGSFEKPKAMMTARLNETEKFIIRDALANRDCRGAFEYLKSEGFPFTLIQIRNQKRFVDASLSSKKGRKKHTNTQELLDLQVLNPTNSFFTQSTDKSGKSAFSFGFVDVEALNIYLSSCPKKEDLVKHQMQIKKLAMQSKTEQRIFLSKFCEDFPEGSKFMSRLMADSTFMLGDFYTTSLIGEVHNFKSKDSDKNRFLTIGFLLHTAREETAHMAFAKFVKDQIKKLDHLETRCPVLIIDGEAALTQYAKAFDCYYLRCGRHLSDNLVTVSSKKIISKIQSIIFGSKTNSSTIKSGVLLAFSENELIQRIKRAEEKLPEKVVDWLLANSKMLYLRSSAYAQLMCGEFRQYNTSNSIENVNTHYKNLVSRPLSGGELARVLISHCADSVAELSKSLNGSSRNIYCVKSAAFVMSNYKEQEEIQKSLGFMTFIISKWDLPSSLSNGFDRKIVQEEEKESNGFFVYPSGTAFTLEKVADGKTKYLSIIKRDEKSDALHCQDCFSLPRSICRHLLAILATLSESNRNIELAKLSKFVRAIEIKRVFERNRNLTAGKKCPKRKGRIGSRGNNKRLIRHVYENSMFLTNDEEYDSSKEGHPNESNNFPFGVLSNGEVTPISPISSNTSTLSIHESRVSDFRPKIHSTPNGTDQVPVNMNATDISSEVRESSEDALNGETLVRNEIAEADEEESDIERPVSSSRAVSKRSKPPRKHAPRDESSEDVANYSSSKRDSSDDELYGERAWRRKIEKAARGSSLLERPVLSSRAVSKRSKRPRKHAPRDESSEDVANYSSSKRDSSDDELYGERAWRRKIEKAARGSSLLERPVSSSRAVSKRSKRPRKHAPRDESSEDVANYSSSKRDSSDDELYGERAWRRKIEKAARGSSLLAENFTTSQTAPKLVKNQGEKCAPAKKSSRKKCLNDLSKIVSRDKEMYGKKYSEDEMNKAVRRSLFVEKVAAGQTSSPRSEKLEEGRKEVFDSSQEIVPANKRIRRKRQSYSPSF